MIALYCISLYYPLDYKRSYVGNHFIVMLYLIISCHVISSYITIKLHTFKHIACDIHIHTYTYIYIHIHIHVYIYM